jgi:PadR family transcriptional regulator, regulatory protein PadR
MVADPAQLLPGTLDLLILRAVSLGPLRGYGILLRIGRISENALLIEQDARYPGLFRLVCQGLLKASWGTSENNRRAKFYELTATGRERLREQTDRPGFPARCTGYDRVCGFQQGKPHEARQRHRTPQEIRSGIGWRPPSRARSLNNRRNETVNYQLNTPISSSLFSNAMDAICTQ